MELVYLWVEEYKNIRKQGFNFSGQFKCDFDGENLMIEENKDYSHIFPENINVTAIVGENGKGKSNLLEFLILNSIHNLQSKVITVTFNSQKKSLVIESYNFNETTIINNTMFENIVKNYETKESERITIKYESFHALSDYELIYYSISPFDRCNVHQNFHRFNYLGILNENGEFKVRDILIKQIKSFVSLSNNVVLKNIIISLELAVPNKILLNPLDHFYLDEKIGEKIADFFGFNDSVQQTTFMQILRTKRDQYKHDMGNFSKSPYHPHHYITDEDERQQSIDMDAIKNFLYLHFFIETIKILLSNSLSKAIYAEQISQFVQQYEDDLVLAIKSFFSSSIVDGAEANPNRNIHLFIENFCQISAVSLYSFAYSKQPFNNQFIIELNQIDDSFLELFKETDMMDAFELSWLNENMHIRLSSGEIAMIDMLCNIMVSLQKAILDNKNKFLLMLDEIELFLHPKWQKKYMKNIITAIESVLGNKKCHILLTSHSPFILSDIPKNYVNFIGEKFVHEQTFGANIHTLLSDSFFMEDGLMGEFAKGKIDQIKEFYDQNKNLKQEDSNFQTKKQEFESKKKDFYYIQSIIGEPFLQTIMKNYLDELEILFYGKKEFLTKEITRLQQLQKSIND